MRIVFISGYPTLTKQNEAPFVQQFVWAMTRQGHDCTVISPSSIFDLRYGPLPSKFIIEDAGNGKVVSVYHPRYISWSSKNLGWTHTGRWTQWAMNRVVLSAFKKLPTRPDLIYGHFLYNSGYAAVSTGKRMRIPSVVGVGEGVFWTVKPFGFTRAKRDFSSAAGFLAVATHIQDGLMVKIGIPNEKIIVEPNGVDLTSFSPTDRILVRKHLGISSDLFLITFVGTFNEMKGCKELVAAVEEMDGVALAMIGQGKRNFKSDKIIHKGRVSHEEVPKWLNAADIFVLPTREEGCSNAVIEAIACGLPIVTSIGPHLEDIVDDDVAIRVDPTNVGAIREAILTLKNNPDRRKQMSEACLKKIVRFNINHRAQRVSTWMESIVRKYQP